ncbi:MAG: hypothetical protein V3V08_11480 [Nannocystaceae bacterium]
MLPAEIDAGSANAAALEAPTSTTPYSEREAETQAKLARMRELKIDPQLRQRDRRYKRMIIGGSAGLGMGALFGLVGLSAAGAAGGDGTDTDAAANLAGVSFLLFLAGAVGGGIFLAKGLRGRKRLRSGPFPTAAALPFVTRDAAGAAILVSY